MQDYVPLGKLEVGTVLHVQGGGEAILVSKTWRQGEFEVFDFEVEGLHNFYVRGEGSDAASVLVHNSTGGKGELTTFYPPNRGFKDGPSTQTLEPGTRIDRYGSEKGTFVSPEGTPVPERALPPGATDRSYNVYEVDQRVDVQAGEAAPWFGQPGGGQQYELPESVETLKDWGVLKDVTE